MNTKITPLILIAIFIWSNCYSQTIEYHCNSDIANVTREKGIGGNAGATPIYRKLSKGEKDRVEKFKDTVVIAVYVHNVYYQEEGDDPLGYVSDICIQEQIEILNRDFAGLNPNRATNPYSAAFKGVMGEDSKIRFRLKSIDRRRSDEMVWQQCDDETNLKSLPEGFKNIKFERHGGIDRVKKVGGLNIWVSQLKQVIGRGGELTGYASKDKWPIDYDGIVMDYRAFGSSKTNKFCFEGKEGGQTLTHEVGHFLGLVHTFGDQCLSFNQKCCTEDDYIDDTPQQENVSARCDPMEVNCNGQPVMVMNFMNYNGDNCLFSFTKGQIEKMRFSLMKGSDRYFAFLSQPDDPTRVNEISSTIPSIKNIYLDDAGKLRITLTEEKPSDNISGHLFQVKSLDDNQHKSVFVAKNEKALALVNSQKQPKSLDDAIRVFSDQGFTGSVIDGLQTGINYEFVITAVGLGNKLGESVKYYYNKPVISQRLSPNLEIVVPK